MDDVLVKINTEKLQEARVKAGLTQDQVAETIGKTKGTISHYENGEVVPPGDILISLLRLYKVIPEKYLRELYILT
jgi:transcriptional regulator with XRE-family HTH domain